VWTLPTLAAGKQLAGEQTDFVALLNDGLVGTVRLRRQFWVVNLKVKALEALAACDELGFADSYAYPSASAPLSRRAGTELGRPCVRWYCQ
jgi:hypothetical protein